MGGPIVVVVVSDGGIIAGPRLAWFASFYYENWTGKKEKKIKRSFPTKREALEWGRTFLQQQTADLDMTFENFVALYVADMKCWATRTKRANPIPPCT